MDDHGPRVGADGRDLEASLARRIGLDPSDVGRSLIARGDSATDGGARARRPGRLRPPSRPLGRRIAGVDRGGRRPRELVLPRRRALHRLPSSTSLGIGSAARWRRPLRALSLPCAGGEEPYTLAIALSEPACLPGGSTSMPWISAHGPWRSPASASTGPTRSAARTDRTRHFRRLPAATRSIPVIRSAVRFLPGNLLDPGLLADASPYDVVFCRNLLIYLEPAARSRAMAALDRLLADVGLLFIGHADRLDEPDRPPRFAKINEPGCFAYRKARPAVPLRPAPPCPAADAARARAVADAAEAGPGSDASASASASRLHPRPVGPPPPAPSPAGAGRRAGQQRPLRRRARRLRAAHPQQGAGGRAHTF